MRDTRLEHFEQAVKEIVPDLILMTSSLFLPTSSNNSISVRRMAKCSSHYRTACLCVLHPGDEQLTDELTDAVFYKPVDVELITQAIEDLFEIEFIRVLYIPI